MGRVRCSCRQFRGRAFFGLLYKGELVQGEGKPALRGNVPGFPSVYTLPCEAELDGELRHAEA